MDKQEIMSLTYEGVVGVEGKKVIRAGVIIDKLNTNEKIEDLFNDPIFDEYGTNDINTIMKIEGFTE